MWDLGPFSRSLEYIKASDQYPFIVYLTAFKSIHSKIKMGWFFLSVTDYGMNSCEEKISLRSGRTF